MRKIFKAGPTILTSIALLVSTLLPISLAQADVLTNLIANPGFESQSSDPTQPTSWTPESWGSNSATFTYLNSGHSGKYSVETTLSSYQDGDAKWIFDPVSISANTEYTYTDWYEATVATNIWAQFFMSDGSVQYQWLGGDAAASGWLQTSVNFMAPANVVRVSVFHVLNADGSLTIDDTNLNATPICNISNANGIYNGAFEQTCPNDPNMPANWQIESYGTPNATYAYTTTAHSGNYGVETSMQGTSGEAGWQTTWQPIAGGQRYGLTFWHNGTAYVYAYLAVRLNDGSLQYMSLMSVPATQNTGWSQYVDNFVAPVNASQIQITIATSEPGYFYLDDVYLNTLTNQVPAAFNQGVVSVTFDDGDASSYTNGYKELQTLGLKGTFYINASMLGTSGYMTKDEVKTMAAHNNEIGSHEYEHLDMVSLTEAQLNYQLTENNAVLHNILGPTYPLTDFASPYGSYTSSTLDTVMSYYRSHRTTDGQFNSKANLDPRTLHAILVTSSTTPAQVKAWINQAEQQNEWLILVYHAIGSSPLGGDGDGYSTTPKNFDSEMTYLKAQTNLKTLPVNAALVTLEAQE